MSVPSTREPQKTPVSQITHGPDAGIRVFVKRNWHSSRSRVPVRRGARAESYLRRALAKRELLMCIPPFASRGPWYLMNPSFLNLFIKTLT